RINTLDVKKIWDVSLIKDLDVKKIWDVSLIRGGEGLPLQLPLLSSARRDSTIWDVSLIN
ncbi:MAG: hypothetical protein QMC83_10240, partial [Thermodesulfovibrionales bacterium]|nr:hypothetical protein [Thermodesulfovibrionales bacterium]